MANASWEKFKTYLYIDPGLKLMLDISRMNFPKDYFDQMASNMNNVYEQIIFLEKGAIANPDENRRVGHYWLRDPDIAPEPEVAEEIRKNLAEIKAFVQNVHSGRISAEIGEPFKNVLVIGIGGSGLGPQFISDAIGAYDDRMSLFFIDNTDPDGMDRIFKRLETELDTTLCLVISKSGGTIETRNGMLEVQNFYQKNQLNFARHAVCITQMGSQLYQYSIKEGWLKSFPMWDWVGGRTSVLSSVGLVAFALQGINIDELLAGARCCDEVTRQRDTLRNPSALLALMWYQATSGLGGKQMVILPYKDRLAYFSKYLQQLLMESLGKEKDLEGHVVHQGIAVYGNKGSTDQHSYVQQLLDGPDNFFVTFIEVLKDREGASPILAENSTSGDYLQAFLLGTRNALTLKGRESITITIDEVTPFTIGVLIGLFERAVSIYALLIHINAYHQPAVEMGKKAAGEAIILKNKALHFLREKKGQRFTVEQIAQHMDSLNAEETLFKLLVHLRENPEHFISVQKGKTIFEDLYFYIQEHN